MNEKLPIQNITRQTAIPEDKLSDRIAHHMRTYRPGGTVTLGELSRGLGESPHVLRGGIGTMIKRGTLIFAGEYLGERSYRLINNPAPDIGEKDETAKRPAPQGLAITSESIEDEPLKLPLSPPGRYATDDLDETEGVIIHKEPPGTNDVTTMAETAQGELLKSLYSLADQLSRLIIGLEERPAGIDARRYLPILNKHAQMAELMGNQDDAAALKELVSASLITPHPLSECEAPPRLITAAPDLYRALGNLLACMDDESQVYRVKGEFAPDRYYPISRAEARAALAKARGEP